MLSSFVTVSLFPCTDNFCGRQRISTLVLVRCHLWIEHDGPVTTPAVCLSVYQASFRC